MTRFTKFIQRHLPIIITLVAITAILLPLDLAFAQEATTTGTAIDGASAVQTTFDQALNQFTGVFSIILQFLSFLLWPILILIGALMDPDLIVGGGAEDRLLSIWTQIRNLVNLGFVIALVGLAIYNVLGIDSDGNYTIKKVLPKFVLGLVLVNFSFFGLKLLIDGANVVTTAMFALPNSVESQFTAQQTIDNLAADVCKGIQSIPNVGNAETQQALLEGTTNFKNKICQTDNTFSPEAKEFFQSFNQNNMALVMAVQFGQIHKMLDPGELVRLNPTLSNISVNILLSAAMFVIYASAYIALLIVLIARLFVLWVVLALSPLVALKIALPEGLDIGTGDIDPQKTFTAHLIAPIKIGFGMSLGYIMLSAFQQVGLNSLTFELGQEFLTPFSGTSTLQDLLIAIATVGIVWKIALEAADDTLAANIVGRVKDFVQNQGTFLAGLPLAAPGFIVPSPRGGTGAGGVSVNQLFGKLDAVKQRALNPEAVNDDQEVSVDTLRNTFKNPGRYIGNDRTKAARALEELKTAIDDKQLQRDTTIANLRSIINTSAISSQERRNLDNEITTALGNSAPETTTLSALGTRKITQIKNRLSQLKTGVTTTEAAETATPPAAPAPAAPVTPTTAATTTPPITPSSNPAAGAPAGPPSAP